MYNVCFLTIILGGFSLLASCAGNHASIENQQSNRLAMDSFEACLIAGGAIMESHPRQCSSNGQTFHENTALGKTGDKRNILFQIGPQTVTCQGAHPIDQECLLVNGEYFYDDIEGFAHKPDVITVIEVERTQICDPEILNSCPQDIGIFTYRLIRTLSESSASKTATQTSDAIQFVGEIIDVEPAKDGSVVKLANRNTDEVLYAVISIPNLGPDSRFNFDTLQRGNLIKVSGELFELTGRKQLTARSALSYTPVPFTATSAAERSRCAVVGGEIRSAGRLQAEHCIQLLPDAGERCSDASECFGRCIIANTSTLPERNTPTTGVCEADDNYFGCTALVSNGRYEGTLCVD